MRTSENTYTYCMKPCLSTLITLILFNCVLIGQQSTDLWAISYVLTDSTKVLTLAEVLDLPDGRFQPPRPGPRPFSKRHPTYLRFDLPVNTSTTTRYLFMSNSMDSIILFQRTMPIARSGGNLHIKDRTIPTSRNGFALPNAAGQYLLKITGYTNSFRDWTSDSITIKILTSSAEWELEHQLYKEKRQTKRSVIVWFLSITLFVILLVFLSWFVLRDVIFGFYLVYVVTIFLYYLVRRSYLFGTDDFYLTSYFRYAFEAFWIPVIIAAYAFFVNRFLAFHTEQQNPWLFWTLRLAIKIAVGVVVTNLILLLFFDLYGVSVFSFYSQFIFALVAIVSVYLLFRNKDRYSRIISAGISLLIFGLLFNSLNGILREKHGINLVPTPIGIFQYAVLGELILYWLGLMYHWHDQRKEASKGQEELLKLQSTIDRQKREQAEKKLIITTPRKQYIWARTQVQGFAANGEITNCLLHNQSEVFIPLRLGQVEEQLPAEFLRVQRSYVVNSSHIVRLEEKSKVTLYLKDRIQSVPVGRKYLEEVRKLFSL